MFNPYSIIIALLLLGGVTGYFFWSQEKISTLVESNSNLSSKVISLSDNLKKSEELRVNQETNLIKLTEANRDAEAQIKRYLSVFKRHNLTELAKAKPGLVQKSINKGTTKLFKELENETSISSD